MASSGARGGGLAERSVLGTGCGVPGRALSVGTKSSLAAIDCSIAALAIGKASSVAARSRRGGIGVGQPSDVWPTARSSSEVERGVR